MAWSISVSGQRLFNFCLLVEGWLDPLYHGAQNTKLNLTLTSQSSIKLIDNLKIIQS